jgi:hypothetical protein
MKTDTEGISNAFTGDSGRSWAGNPVGSRLCRGHPQRGCWDGASLQPGGAAAVREAGTYNTREIKHNSLLFKAVCVPGYISYVLVCVYGINGARSFAAGFWQLLVILSVMNLIDRFLIDGYWVEHTNAWTIPGTEDLKPYITAKDKQKKWLCGTVGMAVIAAVLAAMMTVQ